MSEFLSVLNSALFALSSQFNLLSSQFPIFFFFLETPALDFVPNFPDSMFGMLVADAVPHASHFFGSLLVQSFPQPPDPTPETTGSLDCNSQFDWKP